MAHRLLPPEIRNELSQKELVGKLVVRGPGWSWPSHQDNYGKSVGTITLADFNPPRTVRVRWDHDRSENSYYIDPTRSDLDVIDESQEPTPEPEPVSDPEPEPVTPPKWLTEKQREIFVKLPDYLQHILGPS